MSIAAPVHTASPLAIAEARYQEVRGRLAAVQAEIAAAERRSTTIRSAVDEAFAVLYRLRTGADAAAALAEGDTR
jgi:hypothetical protein